MYQYDGYDQQMLDDRVKQFRSQTQRFLKGELSENEFLPLRLQNGLYIQRLAPLLRIAVPYGLLSSHQLRAIAKISRDFDKGYVHFTTRQNIQMNWPRLEEVPDILEQLAAVQMHAIQTSGACIRNVTSDQFAGVAADERIDPRPYCEMIRQWSTFHPEFAFLPRKFKIAVCGAQNDRAAIRVHDIAVELTENEMQEVGYRIYVGGGLGRTPVVAELINPYLPEKDLLTYLEAILRVYNQLGCRDNKYKARIKILVRAMGISAFRNKVDQEWALIKGGTATLTDKELARIKKDFAPRPYETVDVLECNQNLNQQSQQNNAFAQWLSHNTFAHKIDGYSAVTLSLKRTGIATGNVTDQQLEAIANLADTFSFGEVRSTHEQNMVMADVKKSDLYLLWQELFKLGFATPNIGCLTDIICCPGGDYCSLANAKSIPVAESIQRTFDDLDYLYDLGNIRLNISGCMNGCGHHHMGHIGILGVDKRGQEFYQVSLGGDPSLNTSLGIILGPSFSHTEIAGIIVKIIDTYVQMRVEQESFIDTYRRVGITPFKEQVYDKAD